MHQNLLKKVQRTTYTGNTIENGIKELDPRKANI
jgi:hypothetical protein